jgi:serine/threonine protein kinase
LIAGTPLYMSPEQALGQQNVDGRSDIYSVGRAGLLSADGSAAFVYLSPARVLAAHVYETARPLTEMRPDVPADLEAVVLRCLAKDRNDRFADARTLERLSPRVALRRTGQPTKPRVGAPRVGSANLDLTLRAREIFAIVYRRLVPPWRRSRHRCHRLAALSIIWKDSSPGIRYEKRGPAISAEGASAQLIGIRRNRGDCWKRCYRTVLSIAKSVSYLQ